MTTKQVLLPFAANSVAVRVHPVALFAICDAYIRRSKDQERVIGTLLGSVVEGVYEVKNCYVVPHTETGDQVAVDVQHHTTMFELHQRVAPADIILGWFATGKAIYNSDSLYQEFYKTQAPHTAIHLKVDTTLTDQQFSVAAYQARTLSLGDRQVSLEFVEIPCDVLFSAVERAGVELLNAPAPTPLTEVDGLAETLSRLKDLLATVHAHVADVLAGKVAGDPALGRYLADTLAVVPRMGRTEFERLFNDNVQDSLMVSYLANLLRVQVSLAERLGTMQLPIL